MTRYNYAGPQRIAMRTDVLGLTELYEGVCFFVNDHLGSTSVSLNHNDQRTAELRYNAWGVPRWSYSDLPTQRRYTGQIWDGDTGLYFYNARYYDPAIGRFTQADTIVPAPYDPQSLNRYSYVLNNPMKYTDPTGHFSEQEIAAMYGVDSVDNLWWWGKDEYKDWQDILLAAQYGDILRAEVDGIWYEVIFAKADNSDALVLFDLQSGVTVDPNTFKSPDKFQLFRRNSEDYSSFSRSRNGMVLPGKDSHDFGEYRLPAPLHSYGRFLQMGGILPAWTWVDTIAVGIGTVGGFIGGLIIVIPSLGTGPAAGALAGGTLAFGGVVLTKFAQAIWIPIFMPYNYPLTYYSTATHYER